MRSALVAVVAVGLLVAGCEGNDGPAQPPTPTDSLTTVTTTPPPDDTSTSTGPETSAETSTTGTSTSETSTTTSGSDDAPSTDLGEAPPMPAAAKEPTAEGAEAFVRYYFDLFNFGVMTSTDGHLEPLAAKDCVLCTGLNESLTTLKEDGNHVEEPAVIIDTVDMRVDDKTAKGSIGYTQTVPPQLDDSGDIVVPRGDTNSGTFQFTLTYRDNSWFLQELS